MLTVLCPEIPLDSPTDRRWPARLSARLQRSRVLNRHLDPAAIPALAPLEDWLARRFELQLSGPQTVAAYQRFAYPRDIHDADDAPLVLTAIPSYLHAGLDHLVLNPFANLEVEHEEAQALMASANQFLAEDNISLSGLSPDCWLIQLPQVLDLTVRSSMQATGRNVHAYMPAGTDGRRLRVILNELQMLWNEHPVNLARLQSGRPPINTVWVEGSVQSPEVRHAPSLTATDMVISDDPIIRGLALGMGWPAEQVMPLANAAAIGITATGAEAKIDPLLLNQHAGPVLLELSGRQALTQLDDLLAVTAQAVTVVFTDERQWVELVSQRTDRFRFWRKTMLSGEP